MGNRGSGFRSGLNSSLGSTVGVLTVADLYDRTQDTLSRHAVSDPGVEAEVMVRQALGLDRAQYFAELAGLVPVDRICDLDDLLSRRLGGEPLAYLTNRREFFGLDFVVTPDVLVPRQETELLVEMALEFLTRSRRFDAGSPAIMADVGTGSGAIAVSVAANFAHASIYATDISTAALRIAEANAKTHQVAHNVDCVNGDLIEVVPGKIDLIVANLPYIPSLLLDELPNEVRREPRIALDGGIDGLEPYRRLLGQAKSHIRSHGAIMVELMPDQIDEAVGLATKAFPTSEVNCVADLAGDLRAISVFMEDGIHA